MEEIKKVLDAGIWVEEVGEVEMEQMEQIEEVDAVRETAIERGKKLFVYKTYNIPDGERKYRKKKRPNEEIISKYCIEVNGERWFTYRQLCEILMCVPQTLYNYVRSGDVDALRMEGVTLYRWSNASPEERLAIRKKREEEERRGMTRKTRINKKGKKEVYYEK